MKCLIKNLLIGSSLFIFLNSCTTSLEHRTTASQNTFRVVHYNIRELDCAKLSRAVKDLNSEPQIKEALNIIHQLSPDILSINEMQYDRYQQPNKQCDTQKNKPGQNANRLAQLLKWSQASTFMGDANTGQNAVKMKNGDFSTDPANGRMYADPVNFGLFPGQYALGFISKFPAKNNFFTQDLVWSQFNPNVDLKAFKYIDNRTHASGVKKSFDRKTYELFDKNFIDMVVTIDQKPVHVILLHSIVGGAFGGEMPEHESPNSLRNAEELAFMEWYLTGETWLNGKIFNANKVSYKNRKGQLIDIYPLPKNSYYIALGDWNVDINTSPNKPGSVVLNRLFAKTQKWHDSIVNTQETWNFRPTTRPTQLDYMLVSKNLKIVNSGGYYPTPDKKDLGCGISKPQSSSPQRVVAEYTAKNGQICYIEVNADYHQTKMASDHFPIWADIQFQ